MFLCHCTCFVFVKFCFVVVSWCFEDIATCLNDAFPTPLGVLLKTSKDKDKGHQLTFACNRFLLEHLKLTKGGLLNLVIFGLCRSYTNVFQRSKIGES